MKTEELRYQADGLDMVGQLHLPDGHGGPRPAVLVFPHAFGLDHLSREKAEALAEELGYVALECDIHGGGRAMTTLDEARASLQPMREDAAHVRARTLEAFETLAARPEVDASRIAAIGFCFGGTMAFELALAGADLKAAIGFHAGLKVTSPGDAGQIKGKVLAMLGADDPGIPPEARAEFVKMLSDAKVDYTMTIYGGVVHSFTDKEADKMGKPEMARYDARADRRSWNEMRELLEEVLD